MSRIRSAFTLLELLVVLGLMGLAMAVVAPSFVVRPPSAGEATRRVVASARRAAMRRAQTVDLEVAANGDWRASVAGRDSQEIILSGELPAISAGAVNLRISPLGVCMTRAETSDTRPLVFDPLTCSFASDSVLAR